MPARWRTERRARADARPWFRAGVRPPSLHPTANEAGRILHHHYDANDDQQDGGGGRKLIAVERGVQGGADPAGPDNADHRRFAKVDIEAIESEPDHARHDLRLNSEIDPLHEAGAG